MEIGRVRTCLVGRSRSLARLSRAPRIFTVEPSFRSGFLNERYEAAAGMAPTGGSRKEGWRRACLVGLRRSLASVAPHFFVIIPLHYSHKRSSGDSGDSLVTRAFCSGVEIAISLCFYGSPGRARTADLVINSHPLYQLSYRGMRGRVCYAACGKRSTRSVACCLPECPVATRRSVEVDVRGMHR